MSKPTAKTKTVHSPTLDTIQMVEETLKNMEGSVMTIAELKRKLPRKVNHNTLKLILEYLEKSHKIIADLKGIIWVYTSKKTFDRMMKDGVEYTEILRNS